MLILRACKNFFNADIKSVTFSCLVIFFCFSHFLAYFIHFTSWKMEGAFNISILDSKSTLYKHIV